MGRKKPEKTEVSGPHSFPEVGQSVTTVGDAQRHLIIAMVNDTNNAVEKLFDDAMTAAEAGKFDRVEQLMDEVRSAAEVVRGESDRFHTVAKKSAKTRVEYDEDDEKPKKAKKKPIDEDEDDDY